MRTGAGVGVTTGTGGITSAIPLVTKGGAEAETPANVNMNWFLGIDAATRHARGRLRGHRDGANHPVAGTTVVTSNVWHHAAATYDATTGTWRLYLDGALDKTLALGSAFQPESASIQHAALGTSLTSTGAIANTGGFFAGVIDEARIWNVARTPPRSRPTGPHPRHRHRADRPLRHRRGDRHHASPRASPARPPAPSPTAPPGPSARRSRPGGNTAPVVDTATITPASPTTGQTLTANFTGHDADGDPLTPTYQWTRAALDIGGATSATLDLSLAGNGDKGDLIRVRVTVYDGTARSAPLTSARSPWSTARRS